MRAGPTPPALPLRTNPSCTLWSKLGPAEGGHPPESARPPAARIDPPAGPHDALSGANSALLKAATLQRAQPTPLPVPAGPPPRTIWTKLSPPEGVRDDHPLPGVIASWLRVKE